MEFNQAKTSRKQKIQLRSWEWWKVYQYLQNNPETAGNVGKHSTNLYNEILWITQKIKMINNKLDWAQQRQYVTENFDQIVTYCNTDISLNIFIKIQTSEYEDLPIHQIRRI